MVTLGTIESECFEGFHPELMGCVFTFGFNSCRFEREEQFIKTDERIKALVGRSFNPYVLESLEKGELIMPEEPKPKIGTDGKFNSELDKIKFSSYFGIWLESKYTIENEMKKVYAIYLGQCDKMMKDMLAYQPTYDRANETKDVLELHRMLHSISFRSY